MSLIQQLLEQQLQKQVSHEILSNIQNSTTAVESLIDNLASLREKNKINALNDRIQAVSKFIQLKEEMMRFIYGSGNSELVKEWIWETFGDRRVLLELLEMEGDRIQGKIRQTIKLVFSKSDNTKVGDELRKLLEKAVAKLLNKQPLNHKQIKRIDELNESFNKYQREFNEKVSEFNRKIMIFIEELIYFEEKVKKQFMEILGKGSSEQLKPIENYQSHQTIENSRVSKNDLSRVGSIESIQNKLSYAYLDPYY